MPETAMDEDHSPVHRKHDIRPSRKSPIMNAIPKAGGVKGAPQQQLRIGVLAANPCHHSRPSFLVNNVNHWHSLFRYRPAGIGAGG